VRLLLDAQLPPRLGKLFAEAGHEAFHVFDVLSADATDLKIVAEVNRRRLILVSKDEDFVWLSQRSVLLAQLMWSRSGNMTTSRLWRLIEPQLAGIEQAFSAGERIVEVA
jgi:predicted nuclease of predicted toxin-antitoxin system